MKKTTAIVLALSMLLVLAACGGGSSAPAASVAAPAAGSTVSPTPAAPAKTQILTIGTADTGGTMYPVGAAIAKVINDNVAGVKINVETSKGSPVNATNLQAGEIDLGMISGDVIYKAYNGLDDFASNKCGDLRILAATYPSLSNWMVLDSSGLTYVDELLGKRAAVGPQASTTEIAAMLAFETAGITAENTGIENLGLGDGADAVGDGVIDAAHGFAGIPIAGQLNLSNTKAAHLLAYTDEHLDKIIAANGSYYKTIIPAGTYKGQTEDIPTFGVKCTVAINANLSDDLAYEFAKALHTHIPDLVIGHASMTAMQNDEKFMCTDLPVPLHDGAAKYYKEVGLL